MKTKFASILLSILPFLSISCGSKLEKSTPSGFGHHNDDDDDNDNNSHHGHNNKSYKLVCEGVAFDDSDPFGKRGSFSFEGTKAFKQTSDFVVSNEIQEFNFVNYHLGGACASSIKDFGFGELVVNRLCGRQFRDLAFHTFTEEYNGKIYKGNQSCSLKEKSN